MPAKEDASQLSDASGTHPRERCFPRGHLCRGAKDSIEIQLCEGELDRAYIHLSGKVNGGLPGFSDSVELNGGCVLPGQIERLILALQLAAAEADKLGLLTPRPIPKMKLA